MKKRAILVSILVVIALTALVWFNGYYKQKNSDNLPSLSSIVKMEEAEVNELLIGYHKTQLKLYGKNQILSTQMRIYGK